MVRKMERAAAPATPTHDDRWESTEERCDRCGAQAYVQVLLPSGNQLALCGHHGHKHERQFLATGAVLRDETHHWSATRCCGAGG